MLMIYFGVKIVICIKINAYEEFAHENSNIDVEKNKIFNFLGRLNNWLIELTATAKIALKMLLHINIVMYSLIFHNL